MASSTKVICPGAPSKSGTISIATSQIPITRDTYKFIQKCMGGLLEGHDDEQADDVISELEKIGEEHDSREVIVLISYLEKIKDLTYLSLTTKNTQLRMAYELNIGYEIDRFIKGFENTFRVV